MASFNRLIVAGNLTADIELKYTAGGLAIADVRIAINDRVKKGDQLVDEVTYLSCTTFAKTAELANKYLKKGSSVLFEGRLKLDTWEKDGQKHSKHSMVVDKMVFIGAPAGGGSFGSGESGGNAERTAPSRPAQGALPSTPPMLEEDDIPF